MYVGSLYPQLEKQLTVCVLGTVTWSGETAYVYAGKINTLTFFRILYPKLRNPKKSMLTLFQKKGQAPLPA